MPRDQAAAGWATPTQGVAEQVRLLSQQCLDAYKAKPDLVEEHANIERGLLQGGYGRRQLFELVQNGADAMVGHPPGRITVVLTDTALYCANEGEPITQAGVGAMLGAYMSPKRGVEIGRFGLGFKSVLGISSAPEFFSRSGSFRFDPLDAERRIRKIIPDAERTPTLRIASPVDPAEEARNDPLLQELMAWATTVVRLRRDEGDAPWLSDDLDGFPAQFLLFSPHVANVVLDNREKPKRRELSVAAIGEHLSLSDTREEAPSTWRVIHGRYRPSERARRDAGELADRAELPLVWAVPTAGRDRTARGRFWAFFPTLDQTTLSGVVNAPWKLTEDRRHLLEGDFNQELIEALANLIVNHLEVLTNPADPGQLFEMLPARGRESPSWADEVLTTLFYEVAPDVPVIPDQEGVLRTPSSVRVHPEDMPPSAVNLWHHSAQRPSAWAHPSIDSSPTRRSRVERLMVAAKRRIATVTEWLDALVVGQDIERSAGAIRVAAELIDRARTEHGAGQAFTALERQVLAAKIVVTEEGELVSPNGRTVLLPGPYRPQDDALTFVHEDLAGDATLQAPFGILGIKPVDALIELRARIHAGVDGWKDPEWARYWELASQVSASDALDALVAAEVEKDEIAVKTVAGSWTWIDRVLIPGPVVPADGSRDAAYTLDLQYHRQSLDLLRRLGVTQGPSEVAPSEAGEWFAGVRKREVVAYFNALPQGTNPQRDYIGFIERGPVVSMLDLLDGLSDEGVVALTESALQATKDLGPWRIGHQSRTESYPVRTVPHPVLQRLRESGLVKTTLGQRRPSDSVGRSFGDCADVLPVVMLPPPQAEALGVPDDPERLPADTWAAGFARAERQDDPASAWRLYALACQHVGPPGTLRVRAGDRVVSVPAAEVVAVSDEREYQLLLHSGVAVLQLDEASCDSLVRQWGARTASEYLRREMVAEATGPETPLTDLFPAIRLKLPPEHQGVMTLRCGEIRQEIVTDNGKSSRPVPVHFDGRVLRWDESLSEGRLLEAIDRELKLGLTPDARRALLEGREQQLKLKRLKAIRAAKSADERLLLAVGADRIRRRLPHGLLVAVEERGGSLDDISLAKLAMAVYGVDVLKEYRSDLDEAGFLPPTQWSGSASAREFVESLGFDREFAGFQSARRREPTLEVDGPSGLPPLHGFQSAIKERVRRQLKGIGPQRGLLSLPTGAGKTRVAVESLVDAVREGELEGTILWIAQSDELCEQAVQSWSEVWRTFGPRERVVISRLWSTNEAQPVEDGHQVVVATVHKLQVCLSQKNYDWLANTTAVVIDEAHMATTPMYTAVLDWLGMGRLKERAPLLGLSATPFRGTSASETAALVNRFAKHRLDEGVLGDDPYGTLQDLGVLAKVDHQLLEGAALDLSTGELDELQRMRRLPKAVEERLGTDTSRNHVLLESILGLPDDWPVLLFGTSVEHAKTMAGLLKLEGVTAAAISGATDPGVRKHYIEQFRRGRIRVLTNYAVLTQGFDAPAVRAVYVARPTFSPSVYQQMIGRGLRGPLNGGKDVCLIVNVEDTFAQFGEQLAYREFEYLWSRDKDGSV